MTQFSQSHVLEEETLPRTSGLVWDNQNLLRGDGSLNKNQLVPNSE